MKILSRLLILSALVLSACAAPPKATAPTPQTTELIPVLDRTNLLTYIESSTFILLGEKHDNAAHHQVQLILLANGLSAGDGVVFEMLTPDQQPTIDQFLKGEVAYKDLPALLKWEQSGWPDWSYYGPLFKSARAAGAHILYGSYPRRELKNMMKAQPSDFEALPENMLTDLDEEMKLSHCNLLPAPMIRPMSMMQINKDRLMAAQLIKARSQGKAFLIAGNGHVRKDRGVPFHLNQMISAEPVFVLGMLENSENETVTGPFSEYDATWSTAPAPAQDHCAGLKKRFTKQ